jgi:UDPglucose--hexose-1-phosphate uridylyltransferase
MKMPEFRQNMVSKEWVIIATERAKRPDQFLQKKEEKKL